MALINCPECGKEVSNTVKYCPYCRFKFKKSKGNIKKVILIVIICFILIALGIGAALIIHKNKTDRENEEKASIAESQSIEDAKAKYMRMADSFYNSCYSGLTEAEDTCGFIHDVWYDSIYNNYRVETAPYTMYSATDFWSDFNTSLNLYYDSVAYTLNVSEINSATEKVDKYYAILRNAPDGYDDVKEAAEDLYDIYIKFTTCATCPTGSLDSFTATVNEYDTEAVTLSKKFAAYIN